MLPTSSDSDCDPDDLRDLWNNGKEKRNPGFVIIILGKLLLLQMMKGNRRNRFANYVNLAIMILITTSTSTINEAPIIVVEHHATNFREQ